MAEGTPISDKGGITPSKPLEENVLDGKSQEAPEGQEFEHAMQKAPQIEQSQPSPMKVAGDAKGSITTNNLSQRNFVENVNQLMGQMKGLQTTLKDPNLKLNARTNKLLDAKFKRTKEHINYISSKMDAGKDSQEDSGEKKKVHAVEEKGKKDSGASRLIGFLTDGQAQLEGVVQKASHLKGKKSSIMMQDLMGMQVKLYRAQVEIEFSTAVLQKAIDDTKTLMSVQL